MSYAGIQFTAAHNTRARLRFFRGTEKMRKIVLINLFKKQLERLSF